MLTRLALSVALCTLIAAGARAEPFPADVVSLPGKTPVSLRYAPGDAPIVAHLDGYPCDAVGPLERRAEGGWRGTLACTTERRDGRAHALVWVYLDGEELAPSTPAPAEPAALPVSYVAASKWPRAPWLPSPPQKARWRIGRASQSDDPLLRRLLGLECSSTWTTSRGQDIYKIELSCDVAKVDLMVGQAGDIDLELVRPKGAHVAPSIAPGSTLVILGHEGEPEPPTHRSRVYPRVAKGSVLAAGTRCVAAGTLEGSHGWYTGGVRCGDILAKGLVAVGQVKPPRPVAPPAKNARFDKNGGEDFEVRVLAFGPVDAQRSELAPLIGEQCKAPELTRTATGWYAGRLWCGSKATLVVHEVAVEVVATPKLVLISPSPTNPCGPPPPAVLKRHKLSAVKAPGPLAVRYIVTRLEQYAHVPAGGAAVACSLVSDGKATWALPDNGLLPARVLGN